MFSFNLHRIKCPFRQANDGSTRMESSLKESHKKRKMERSWNIPTKVKEFKDKHIKDVTSFGLEDTQNLAALKYFIMGFHY